MASSRQAPAADQPRHGEFDPVHEWLDDGGSYLLRLSLPGFKKEDFRVHVDADGRLTVIGQGVGHAAQLHKAFKLPNTANLDGITGRFDGAVLTLTVPKLRESGAVALQPPTQTKEEQAAADEPGVLQEDMTAAPKVGHAEAEKMERGIENGKASMSVIGENEKEEEDTRKAEAAPPLSVEKANGARRDQDEKASADHRAYVAREAARRIEAARAKVAEAKAAAERTGGQWKERAAAEGFKWAETMGQKKEMIATAVAAFTLGVFVSQALGRR